MELNADQTAAMEKLSGSGNVFLTGAAGTGKSFVLRKFLEQNYNAQLLATTGAAALVIGGRTFHSFFSLWNFSAGFNEMIDSALQNPRLAQRIQRTETIVIDEVSMLSQDVLRAGDLIAREVTGRSWLPWGGIRVIAVGDFCQLPPVQMGNKPIEWVFNADTWADTNFETVELKQVMRTAEPEFLEVLGKVRRAHVDNQVKAFLAARSKNESEDIQGTRLFARKMNVIEYNKFRLAKLPGDEQVFPTEYVEHKENAKKRMVDSLVFDDVLRVKPEALLMIRANDKDGQYANGSLGFFEKVVGDTLYMRLMNGTPVMLEKKTLTLMDGDKHAIGQATNFPVNLAWAMTVHKAQGATMDSTVVDMNALWESGHAYVAMSRTRSADGLHIMNWRRCRFHLDPQVKAFYNFPSVP